MKQHQKILIKDPYLNTTTKSQAQHQHSSYLQIPKNSDMQGHQYPQYKHRSSVPSYSAYPHQAGVNSYGQSKNPQSKYKIEQDIRAQLQATRNQYKRMTQAYTHQSLLNKKILDYQTLNNQYHQSLKIRNLDLNNKLSDLATQNYVLVNRFQSDNIRNFQEKDLILKKFQIQAEELLQAKKTINTLMEHKTRLQGELEHMVFLLQKQSDRFNLDMKEQGIRMEGLQRTIKNITDTKDQQITQLRHRLRIYEDENKRLSDQNRTFHLAHGNNISSQTHAGGKQNRGGIENLSQINYLDSQAKDRDNGRDIDSKTINKQLQEQKTINDKLHKQIEDLKKKLFKSEVERQREKQGHGAGQYASGTGGKGRNTAHELSPNKNDLPVQKVQGIINSLYSLRNGIAKQVFQLFHKSVKDGQKHRSNSLIIFIQNWKHLDLPRLEPYISSYFQTRDSLKELALSKKYQSGQIHSKLEQCIPLHIALRKGRSQINMWILSTIQLTKNQRQSGKKTMNNLLLFLFRLLTIEYRIIYPMQGKSYAVDKDVRNQLYHQIVKAINYISQFK